MMRPVIKRHFRAPIRPRQCVSNGRIMVGILRGWQSCPHLDDNQLTWLANNRDHGWQSNALINLVGNGCNHGWESIWSAEGVCRCSACRKHLRVEQPEIANEMTKIDERRLAKSYPANSGLNNPLT